MAQQFKNFEQLPPEIQGLVADNFDDDARTQFANTSRSSLKVVPFAAGVNERGRAPRTAYVAGIEEFVNVLQTTTKTQFDAICECIRQNTPTFWTNGVGPLTRPLSRLVDSIVVMHLQSLSENELMSEIYAALLAMTSNEKLLFPYMKEPSLFHTNYSLLERPVCAPGVSDFSGGPTFYLEHDLKLMIKSAGRDVHNFQIDRKNFPPYIDPSKNPDEWPALLQQAAEHQCEIQYADRSTLISSVAELVSSFFDILKGLDMIDHTPPAAQPFIDVLNANIREQFEAICLRISRSQPDFKGKEHPNVHTFVKLVVHYYLQNQGDADLTDQIYTVLQALVSKDELLDKVEILNNHQCGEICVPAKKPTYFEKEQKNTDTTFIKKGIIIIPRRYTCFYVLHRNVVRNPDITVSEFEEIEHNALLVVRVPPYRYSFPIQNFPEAPPANLTEALQQAASLRCALHGFRTNYLIESIADIASSFFYPDPHREDRVARIRRAFVDYC